MRVSCPNCSTQYEVPDAALAGRSRKLRCELCRHAWRTPAPELGPAPLPAWAAFPARKPGTAPAEPAPVALPPAAAPVFAPPPPPAYAPPVAAAPPPAATPIYAPPPPPVYAPPPQAAAPPPVGVFPLPPVALVSAPPPAIQPPAPPEPPLPSTAPLPEFDPPARVWPPLAEPDNLIQFPPPEARQFGKPVDESAQAEVLQAVAQEQKWRTHPAPEPDDGPMPMPSVSAPEPTPAPEDPDRELPAFLTAAGADETLMLTAPYAAVGGDRFAELVYAARNKAIEVEPEKPPPPPPVRTSNTSLFISLVLAFLVAVTLLEHSEIMHIFPASTGFFRALGLK